MRFARAQSFCLIATAASLLAAAAPNLVQADDGPRIVRVEETWELHLADPDSINTAPQVTCAFTPFQNLNSFHATFEINHQATPEFSPGGLHFHAWNGDQRIDSRHEGSGSLQTAGEVVRWKQVMSVADGQLVFEIADGSSTTWGSFGGEQRLRIAVPATVTNLNSYSPSVSVSQTGVGFAGNRVAKLVLTHVKVVTGGGFVLEDSTDRAAYSLE